MNFEILYKKYQKNINNLQKGLPEKEFYKIANQIRK